MNKCIRSFLIPFFFINTLLFGKDVIVNNVWFEQQGTDIIVYYNLEGNVSKKYNVTLKLSDNAGNSYDITPRAIEGDAGKNVISGKNRKIVWHFTKDFKKGLEGENFVFSVQAKLDKGRSKLPWYLIGAGVIGGGVYFVTQSGGNGSDDPTKGSISITIPGDI